MTTEQLSMSMFASRADYDAAVLEQRIAELEAERANTAAHVASIARQLGDDALQVDDIAVRVLGLAAERDELRKELDCAEEAADVAACSLVSEDSDGYECVGSYVRAVTQQLVKERDELRARLDAIEAQESVAADLRPNGCSTWHRFNRTEDAKRWIADPWPGIEEVRLLYVRPAPAQAVPDFDLTLDCEASQYLHDMTEPADDGEPATAVRLLFGAGHSGRGLYVCSAEYPGEGAVLIAAAPEAAR